MRYAARSALRFHFARFPWRLDSIWLLNLTEDNMNKTFNKTLLLAILAYTLVTACSTAAPLPNGPAPTQLPTQSPVATGAAISFTRDILPIFESRCINCHGGRKTEKGLDLKTYASLMAGSEKGAVLIPGDTQNSRLAQLLLEGKMPKRGTKLTSSQVQLVLDWIKSGAENN